MKPDWTSWRHKCRRWHIWNLAIGHEAWPYVLVTGVGGTGAKSSNWRVSGVRRLEQCLRTAQHWSGNLETQGHWHCIQSVWKVQNFWCRSHTYGNKQHCCYIQFITGLKFLSNVSESKNKILSPTVFSPWKWFTFKNV